jgi:hypothetical protein
MRFAVLVFWCFGVWVFLDLDPSPPKILPYSRLIQNLTISRDGFHPIFLQEAVSADLDEMTRIFLHSMSWDPIIKMLNEAVTPGWGP